MIRISTRASGRHVPRKNLVVLHSVSRTSHSPHIQESLVLLLFDSFRLDYFSLDGRTIPGMQMLDLRGGGFVNIDAKPV